MAVITKDTFDPLRRYVGVRLQQGVPIVDADWNEMEDARRFELRAYLKWFVGDGVPDSNDGFRIVGDNAIDDFLISAGNAGQPPDALKNVGRILVDGLDVIIASNVRFTDQPLHTKQGNSAKLAAAWGVPVIAPIPAPVQGENLWIYLDVWERVVTPTEDPSLVHPGLGTESCARRKREWVVRARGKPGAPVVGQPDYLADHVYLVLASIERPGNELKIAPEKVTDLRRRGLKLTAIDTRLAQLEQSFAGTAAEIKPLKIFTSYVGIGTTNNTASLAMDAPNLTQTAFFRKLGAGPHYSHIQYGAKGDWYIRSSAEDGVVVLQDHTGSVGIGTNAPAAKLQVRGGAIMPEVGNSESAGILFPKNPGGGASDSAFLRYSVESGETTTLRLGTTNDADDTLRLYQNNADRLIINKGQVTIGTEPYAGNNQRWLNAQDEIKSYGASAGYRMDDRTNRTDTKKEWVIYSDTDNLYFWNGTIGNAARISLQGQFFAQQKNFAIDHPLDPEHKGLIHSAMEGPEVGVYYRGEAELNDGVATVELPPYFEALTRRHGRTVQLTPIWGGPGVACGMLAAAPVQDGRFTVHAVDSQNPSQRFYWEVKAIRADQPELEVEVPKPPRPR